jgi:type II secretory pathway predicted ATPase ExeA
VSAEFAPYALDPFGPSANPSAYVACQASERARLLLERSLDEGRVAAVMGPPGHGKTLLLRLIGGREEDRARVAYVPFSTLEFDDLCTVVLNAIGVSRPGAPREVLAAVTRELAPRGGVVILVDDAHALPDACATALAALYEELGGALRIALAAVQGPAAQRVFRAFGSAIDIVLLASGMTGRESRRYVEMRLAYGGARPELVAAFDEATVDALHRASQGVPRCLNQAAEDVVRRATRSSLPRLRELSEPPAPAAKAAPTRAPSPRSVDPAILEAARMRAVPPPPSPPPERRAASAPTAAVPPPPAASPPERPPLPRTPIPVPIARPQPVPPPQGDEADDGRGILLPEIFDRVPGEPAGEYRFVRGTPHAAAPGTTVSRGPEPASAHHRTGIPESVLIAAAPAVAPTKIAAAPPAAQAPARRRGEVPMPSAYADRVPKPGTPPASGLPIRLIGVTGFALGVGISLVFMLGRNPQPLRLVPDAGPTAAAPSPAPDVVAAPPAPDAAVAPPGPTAAAPTPAPAAPPVPAPAARARVAVSINATPWAIVRVDGKEIGETPLAGVELEAGRHVFQARMPDGTTREQTIDVSPRRATVVFQ